MKHHQQAEQKAVKMLFFSLSATVDKKFHHKLFSEDHVEFLPENIAGEPDTKTEPKTEQK